MCNSRTALTRRAILNASAVTSRQATFTKEVQPAIPQTSERRQPQADVFRQFQDGLKDCLTQMTAYKLEMENLRRNAQEEEAERRRQSSQQMGYKDTTFQLSYGNQGGKAPAGSSKGKQGSGSGHGASSQSKSPGQGKSGGPGDAVGRGPCFTCRAEGHFARNCPSRKGERGQMSEQSPGGTSPQQQQQQQTSAGTQYEPRIQLIGQSAKK